MDAFDYTGAFVTERERLIKDGVAVREGRTDKM
jgi:hypothetical protein